VLDVVPTLSGGGGREGIKTKRAKSDDLALERLFGAGNGIRTRDFNLGKVALYH
jgi:hypothetical protein